MISNTSFFYYDLYNIQMILGLDGLDWLAGSAAPPGKLGHRRTSRLYGLCPNEWLP